MKILQLHNKYLEKGGEDTVVANERQLLEQNGNEVMLCEFDNKDLEGVSSARLFFKMLFNLNSYRKVKETLETFKPDVVHIHNVYYTASPSVLLALKRKGIPAVMTIHNYRLGCIQSLLFRGDSICQLCIDKKSSWSGVKNKCFKDSYLKSFMLTVVNKLNRFIIRHFKPINKFIFLSEFTRKTMSPIIGITDTEGVIKPNYVQDKGFTPSENREDFYLFVGRLNEQKGLKILVDIFKKNNKKLVIIGTGPLEDYVKETCKTHQNIQYLGFAQNDFIIENLKKCRALLVPSITYEGQPMTILEAYSTGTPVFASNIKNLDTIIKDSVTGFLFDPYYINYIFKVFENFEEQEMSNLYINARNEYEAKYSPESNYEQLIHIYESIIPNSNRPIISVSTPQSFQRGILGSA
jgi:glycosyltransferase involved in cell wall biosynthesis